MPCAGPGRGHDARPPRLFPDRMLLWFTLRPTMGHALPRGEPRLVAQVEQEFAAGRRVVLPVHPTQLYSALAGAIILGTCGVLLLPPPRRRGDGALMVLYSITRWPIESLRGDEHAILAGMTLSQNISVGLFLLGLVFWVRLFALPATVRPSCCDASDESAFSLDPIRASCWNSPRESFTALLENLEDSQPRGSSSIPRTIPTNAFFPWPRHDVSWSPGVVFAMPASAGSPDALWAATHALWTSSTRRSMASRRLASCVRLARACRVRKPSAPTFLPASRISRWRTSSGKDGELVTSN